MSSVHHDSFSDEITLSELLTSFAKLFSWLKRHFIGISLSVLLCSVSIILWQYSRPNTYTANLTFMLNDDNNPQLSAMTGILGQLGLPLPSGKYNVDKLLEIAKSRTILENALFEKIDVGGRETFLANHFIQVYQLGEKWKMKNEDFADFRFESADVRTFSERENFALKSLYEHIIGIGSSRGSSLFKTDYGKLDYIMSFSTTTLSENLSIAFTNAMYDQVSSFYVQKATEKNKGIYDLIKAKRDSLAQAVQQTSLRIAQLKDKNARSFRNTSTVEISNLTAYLIGLETAYQEVEKSLNSADIALQTATPLIQLLDRPIAPISPDKTSLVKLLLIGIALGIIVYLFIFFLNQIYLLSKKGSE